MAAVGFEFQRQRHHQTPPKMAPHPVVAPQGATSYRATRPAPSSSQRVAGAPPTTVELARLPTTSTDTTIRVFKAKAIRTMDADCPNGRYIAIKGDRIVAVAEDIKELEPWLKSNPHNIDETTFADKVLMPGMIDPHLHPTFAAGILGSMKLATPDDWNLPTGLVSGCPTAEAFWSRITSLSAEHAASKPNEPLVIFGFNPVWHASVNRPLLDKYTPPNLAVVLVHRSFHEQVHNTAALTQWGYLDPESDMYKVVSTHNQVDLTNGHFYENGLQFALAKIGPTILNPANTGKGMAMIRQMTLMGGVTTTCDPMALSTWKHWDMGWELCKKWFDAPEATFRTLFVGVPALVQADIQQNQKVDGLTAAKLAQEKLASMLTVKTPGNRLLWLPIIKLFSDGAFISHNSRLRFPGYVDGHEGQHMMTKDQLRFFAEPYWKNGWDVYGHCTGDLGVDDLLDVLAGLLADHPRADYRFDLHHFGISREDQVERARRLGASVSMNGYYLNIFSDALFRTGMGTAANTMTRGGSVSRAQLPLSLHSDLPMGPVLPLLAVQSHVTRKTPSGTVRGPNQKLTREQALHAVTTGAAYGSRMEHELGSLSPGKKADIAVLDADPFEVAEDKIADCKVHGVFFEGQFTSVAMGLAKMEEAFQALELQDQLEVEESLLVEDVGEFIMRHCCMGPGCGNELSDEHGHGEIGIPLANSAL